jgi:hypothetical protein
LRWLAINTIFPCHFAHFYIVKNKNKRKKFFKFDDYYQENYGTAQGFDIFQVLHNDKSIAYQSVQFRKDCAGASTIDDKTYYCYAFYEQGVQQPIYLSDSLSLTGLADCDVLSIIGWPAEIYTKIKKLQLRA